MLVTFWQTSVRFWFFLSYLITTVHRLITIFIIRHIFWKTLAFFERNPIEKKEVIINCWIRDTEKKIFTHWLPISVLLGRINLNLSLILGLTFGNKSKRKNLLHARFVWFLSACGLKLDSFVFKPQRQPLILLLKFGTSEKGTKFEKKSST